MRAVALIDGEHSPGGRPAGAARAALRVGRRDPRRRHARSSATASGLRRAARRRLRRGRAGRRPLGRAGARPGRALPWASRALAAGLPYVGADFRFDPPVYEPIDAAVDRRHRHRQARGQDGRLRASGGLLARDRDVVVVTMGRGGPPEPELIEAPPGVDGSRRALALGPARGLRPPRDRRRCRRRHDRLPARRRRARRPAVRLERRRGRTARGRARAPDVIVFDGSGTAIPPIAADRRVLVVGAGARPRRRTSTLPAADLRSRRRRRARARGRDPRRRSACGRSTPLTGRVAVFTAGARRDVAPRGRRRPRLEEPRRPRRRSQRELAAVDADTYLTELKGAAIDLVAEHALARGRRVVLAANDVVGPGLDEALLALVPEVVAALMHPHYANPLPLGDPTGLPYSKGLMARSLVAAGVALESAYVIARSSSSISSRRALGGRIPTGSSEVAAEVLGDAEGAQRRAAPARLAALQALDVPIVCSSAAPPAPASRPVATEAAHRLGITRVTSTDFIRQTIRAYFPPSQMPSVHCLELRGGRERTSPRPASSSRRAASSSGSRRSIDGP